MPSLSRAELAKADAEPFIKDWYTGSASSTTAVAAQARARLLAPGTFNALSDDAVRTLLNAQAYYYRHYAPANQRAQTGATYARLVGRFPQDYTAAIYYLQAATDYGPAELAREAALHLMKFKPETSDSDLFRRLMIAADNNKDAALARQALNWIMQSEQAFGKKIGYAYQIGDFLLKYELENEAVAYWQAHVDLDGNNVDCRHCADRLLARIEGAPRIAFLQKMLATPSDYHGTYSMWLAGEHLTAGNLDAFEKTLQTSRKLQDERPFRGWGMEDRPGAGVGRSLPRRQRSDTRAETACLHRRPRPARAALFGNRHIGFTGVGTGGNPSADRSSAGVSGGNSPGL